MKSPVGAELSVTVTLEAPFSTLEYFRRLGIPEVSECQTPQELALWIARRVLSTRWGGDWVNIAHVGPFRETGEGIYALHSRTARRLGGQVHFQLSTRFAQFNEQGTKHEIHQH